MNKGSVDKTNYIEVVILIIGTPYRSIVWSTMFKPYLQINTFALH